MIMETNNSPKITSVGFKRKSAVFIDQNVFTVFVFDQKQSEVSQIRSETVSNLQQPATKSLL